MIIKIHYCCCVALYRVTTNRGRWTRKKILRISKHKRLHNTYLIKKFRSFDMIYITRLFDFAAIRNILHVTSRVYCGILGATTTTLPSRRATKSWVLRGAITRSSIQLCIGMSKTGTKLMMRLIVTLPLESPQTT